MGVILRQSFWNMIGMYLGYALGAVNTLFLFTRMMTPENYGLVISVLSLSAIISPLFCWGMNNAVLYFFPRSKDPDRTFSFILLLPLLFILPVYVLGTGFGGFFDEVFSEQTAILHDYVPIVFWMAVFMCYFEIFLAYSKIHLRSVEGGFLKELFHRLATSVLLIAVFAGAITQLQFMYCLAGAYLLRTVCMAIVAFRIAPFRFRFSIPENFRKIFVYGMFSSLGFSAWTLMYELDKSMLPSYESLSRVAYYSVSVYIGMVIAAPLRSLGMIATPVLSRAIAEEDLARQKDIYVRSSTNLIIVTGLLLLLVNCNLDALFTLLPKEYDIGAPVVLLTSAACFVDGACGLNANFIMYSKHYRWDLLFNVLLIVMTIGTNLWFIPRYGLVGAALATFLCLLTINLMRLFFVRRRMGVFPFNVRSYVMILLIALLYLVFSQWSLPDVHPFLSIVIKSAIITCIFLGIVLGAGFSQDIRQIVKQFIEARMGRGKQ